jgi:selenoprotein W-related protein
LQFATSLVTAIRKVHGGKIETKILPGSGGVFDVQIDGDLVYSKWDTGRFPSNDQILAMIAEKTGP